MQTEFLGCRAARADAPPADDELPRQAGGGLQALEELKPAAHEIWTLGRASRLDEPLRSTAHPEDSPYLEQSISLGRLVLQSEYIMVAMLGIGCLAA